jgi:poly-gamma-glutamate synthesis protein (capsule biosynthesis protein)
MKILSALLLLVSLAHSETATISFVGDVNFTGRIGEQMAVSGTTWPFEKVKDILVKADYRVCNLESPAGIGGAKYCEKSVYFKANPQYLDALTDGGFNMVSLANNHALDYGPEVLSQTCQELDKRNIAYIGIRQNNKDPYIPKIVKINGLTVAFFGYCNACPNEFGPTSYTAGVNVGMKKIIREQIAKIKHDSNPDFIVAMPHWGTEYGHVDQNQMFTQRVMWNAGVDIVIGAHPHVLQKAENINGFCVAYSLGNFLFPMRWNVSLDSAILFVELTKNGDKKQITTSWTFVSLDSNRPVRVIDPNGERFKRDRYTIENGYDYPENRRWPEIGPWSKNGKAN